MKKIFLIITAVVFSACNNPANYDSSDWGGVISPTDERNDKITQFIDAYANNDLQSCDSLVTLPSTS